jgi:hypothetical protein
MIFISHRGNRIGKSSLENRPEYVMAAIDAGYYVEIDVWKNYEGIFLGHDAPQYQVSFEFFHANKLLCHAKNLEALFFLMERNVHYFWHQEDDYALTSRSIFITHPKALLMSGSIAMLPEIKNSWTPKELDTAFGICSDNIEQYRKAYNERVIHRS